MLDIWTLCIVSYRTNETTLSKRNLFWSLRERWERYLLGWVRTKVIADNFFFRTQLSKSPHPPYPLTWGRDQIHYLKCRVLSRIREDGQVQRPSGPNHTATVKRWLTNSFSILSQRPQIIANAFQLQLSYIHCYISVIYKRQSVDRDPNLVFCS